MSADAGQRTARGARDVDVAKAISEMKNNELGVEAALQAYASLGRVSLFQVLG
ncbi:MAG TPA: hypothetical protein VLJ86_22300 [Ramlibacter sp.]|nr:hypothetical protein [Ramlibacter sp.]